MVFFITGSLLLELNNFLLSFDFSVLAPLDNTLHVAAIPAHFFGKSFELGSLLRYLFLLQLFRSYLCIYLAKLVLLLLQEECRSFEKLIVFL